MPHIRWSYTVLPMLQKNTNSSRCVEKRRLANEEAEDYISNCAITKRADMRNDFMQKGKWIHEGSDSLTLIHVVEGRAARGLGERKE
jgi:hypothetical protein